MKQKQNKKEEKNIKKKIISNTITGVLVAVIVSGIGVGAVTLLASSEVTYNNTNSGATSSNVQGAIDELYELANNQDYYDPYAVGTPVYFNPVSGTKCFDYVGTEDSLNENKTGCMKWYIIGEGTDTVDMILDHNTTYEVKWHSSNSTTTGPSTLLTQLHTDTDAWTGVPTRTDSYTDPAKGYTINYSGYRARLIEANEIARITGADKAIGWDSATPTTFFYLDGKYGTDSTWQTEVASGQGASKYAWLYDYTNGGGISDICTLYGCNIGDATSGYWTSSASASRSDSAWVVYYDGSLSSNYVVNNTDIGLRPVITISKSEVGGSGTITTTTGGGGSAGGIGGGSN